MIRHQPKNHHNRNFVMRRMRLFHGLNAGAIVTATRRGKQHAPLFARAPPPTPRDQASSISRTLTFLPFTLPALSLRTASRAMLRSTAT